MSHPSYGSWNHPKSFTPKGIKTSIWGLSSFENNGWFCIVLLKLLLKEKIVTELYAL